MSCRQLSLGEAEACRRSLLADAATRECQVQGETQGRLHVKVIRASRGCLHRQEQESVVVGKNALGGPAPKTATASAPRGNWNTRIPPSSLRCSTARLGQSCCTTRYGGTNPLLSPSVCWTARSARHRMQRRVSPSVASPT